MSIRFIEARIADIEAATASLPRNVDKQEWRSLESNLQYVAAKANSALNALRAMQAAWVVEMYNRETPT